MDFFLKIYSKHVQLPDKKPSIVKHVTPLNEYELMSDNLKNIKETTTKNKIKHNIVESELYSLENSTQSFFEKIGRNRLPLSNEQKHYLSKEINNEYLLSDVENPGAYSVLNKMITFSRLKFDQFRSKDGIAESTLSKFYKEPVELAKDRFVLGVSDRVILRVLEKMVKVGFPLQQIQESVRMKKLDAAYASFRLLVNGLCSG